MKTILIIWGVIIVACILEAYFFTIEIKDER